MSKFIVVVEDDESIREMLRYYFQSVGYEVHAYDSGEALFEAEDWSVRPALCILDIMLPGMDGLEILHRLRSGKATEEIPAIMLTARTLEIDRVTGLESGADDYVVKPFSIPIFLKKVESLLRRCGKLQGEELIYGHLRIDVNGYAVFWDLAPVELTLTEFELLKTLVQHHGQILTRSQLLDQVWGFDYIGEERIVDAHIKNLRRKLPENIINTVKGIGYYIS